MDDLLPLLVPTAIAATAAACAVPLYVRRGLRRVLRQSRRRIGPGDALPGVSIIVSAHNEEKEIGPCLEALRDQDYPDRLFEIIVVNDRSTDGTQEILDRFSTRHSFLRSVRIAPDSVPRSPKKQALAAGIGKARFDILLFTDADCRPGARWLRTMAERFSEETGVVLGFSPIRRGPGLLNLLSRFETYRTAAMMFGFAGNGRPFMSVGRNWGYRKSVYSRSGGMEASGEALSGDDDLLLQGMLRRGPTAVRVCADRESFVPTGAETRFRTYIRRKMRHFSAAAHYAPGWKLLLGAGQAAMFASILGSFLAGFFIHPACAALPLAPISIQYGNIARAALDVERPGIGAHLAAFLTEPVYVLFFSFIAIPGILWRPRWS